MITHPRNLGPDFLRSNPHDDREISQHADHPTARQIHRVGAFQSRSEQRLFFEFAFNQLDDFRRVRFRAGLKAGDDFALAVE